MTKPAGAFGIKESLQCIKCATTYPVDVVRYRCDCGSLLALERPKSALAGLIPSLINSRRLAHRGPDASGVWRYREAVLDLTTDHVVSHPEGDTHLYERPALNAWAGVDRVRFKHEGENPTGSFKDRGMTVAVSQARRLGFTRVACASTGNTSASLAAYAAQAGMGAVVFLPAGKVAAGKLAQTLGYGALGLAVRGDFDAAMRLVQEAATKLGVYVVNSLNPFRLEGQKTIMFELLDQLDRKAPDWIVVPAGNLGNTSAFGKALREAHAAGWIDKMPRIAAVQAAGAAPFHRAWETGFKTFAPVSAETVATAIRIGDPVNYPKAVNEIRASNGLVAAVSDAEILAAKEQIDRTGIGCEPASAASLAGVRALKLAGTIRPTDDVVCILTGNILKDSDVIMQSQRAGSALIEVDATLKAVEAAIASHRL
jgi:threonine synthase